MSTEALKAADAAKEKKKSKKDKVQSREKSSKKRKREEEQQDEGIIDPLPDAVDETVAPQKKKRKSEAAEEASVVAEPKEPAGHQKKSKKSKFNGTIEPLPAVVDEPVSHKKKKRTSEAAEEAPDIAEPEDTRGYPAKSKKKREEGPRDEDTVDALPDTIDETASHSKKRPLIEAVEEASVVIEPEEEHHPTEKSKISKSKSDKEKHPPATKVSTISKADKKRLEKHSPFLNQTSSFYLPLSPCAISYPIQGLCAEHISPLILTYYPPLHGIILSYTNVRISSSKPTKDDLKLDAGSANQSEDIEKEVLGQSINEYGVTFVWLTADFLLFRPSRGTWVEGTVNLQNESFLGLVCYNYFNAVIPREKLPEGWRWVEDGDDDVVEIDKEGRKAVASLTKKRRRLLEGLGRFVDGKGKPVGGRLVFRVEDFEAIAPSDGGSGTVSILGTLLSEGPIVLD